MHRFAHWCARKTWVVPLATIAAAAVPSVAAADVTAGGGALAGSVTPSHPWSVVTLDVAYVPQTLQVSENGVVVVDSGNAHYAGPVTLTATGTTQLGDPNFLVGLDFAPATISISGSDGLGHSLACQTSGQWVRTYMWLRIYGWGTCNVNGVDVAVFTEQDGALVASSFSGISVTGAALSGLLQIT